MKIDITSYIDKKEIEKNKDGIEEFLSDIKENSSKTFFKNPEYKASDLSQNDAIDRFTYVKPNLGVKKDESLAKSILEDINSPMNKTANDLAVIANTVSAEDLKKLEKNGYSINDTDVKTIVSVTDKIKATLAKAGVDISKIYGSSLSSEELKEITGDVAIAKQIERSLKEKDLPVNKEIMEKALDSYEKASDISKLQESTISYIVKNDIEPTISNVYLAQKSAGIKPNLTENLNDFQRDNINDLKKQIDEFLIKNGYEKTNQNIDNSKTIIANNINLTKENLDYYNELSNFEKLESTQIIDKLVSAVMDGKSPESAYILTGYSYSELAIKDYEIINSAEVEDLEYVIEENKDVTISNLADSIKQRQDESRETTRINNKEIIADKDLKILMAKRQLEEVRLMMTIDANYKLLKQGVALDTKPLEEIVDELKNLEQEYYDSIFKEKAVSSEKIDRFEATNFAIEELKNQPSAILGRVDKVLTINELNEIGDKEFVDFKRVNENYEKVMTQPMAQIGDSIKKAFSNSNYLLENLGLDVNEENLRAVRILGYNSEDVTIENIEKVRDIDIKIQNTFKNLTPNVTVEIIQRGINPLDIPIEDLNNMVSTIAKEVGPTKQDKFSEYLWKLEKNSDISPEERKSYIGIYRLISQVEKTDGSVVGMVLKQDQKVTMRNLLTAIRSKNKLDMDYEIDDDFNGVDSKYTNAIDKQIEEGIVLNANKAELVRIKVNNIVDEYLNSNKLSGKLISNWQDMNLDDLKKEISKENEEHFSENTKLENEYFEEVKNDFIKVLSTKDEVIDMLEKYDMPCNLINLLGARSLRQPDKVLDMLFNGDFSEIEKVQKMKEEIIRRFGESIKEPKEMADAQEELADLAEHAMDDMLVENKTITAKELKSYRIMASSLKIMAKQSREEAYVIPVDTADGVAGIKLRIVRTSEEKGMVNLLFKANSNFKVASSLKVIGDNVGGMIASDNNEIVDKIKKSLDVIKNKLPFDDNKIQIDIAYSENLDLNKFDNSKITSEYDWKQNEKESKPQTKVLYNVAEILVKQFSDL
ncbi:DUF6240 domain-containing protein [Lachnobacterium bovis]|uniref:DUF6240 domain-containing protein n=1 Tax=Lachnobacterium bovis TaxID=140626 RepID=UPI0003B3B2CF|nr:DUF6240 domain-containing protein [Lachnobacterium bovis]